MFELALALHLEIEYRKYLWMIGTSGGRPQSRRHWLDSNPTVTQGV